MFDLDGTLADTASANQAAYTEALKEVGATISPEDFGKRVQGRHWREFLPAILSEASSSAEPASVAARKGLIYAEKVQEVKINRALVELLDSSRPAMKTALVTSAARVSVMNLLNAHGLCNSFDVIVTGDDVACHKPDPEAYRLAASQLGVRAEECLIFEDSAVGVESARRFGGQVVRVVFP